MANLSAILILRNFCQFLSLYNVSTIYILGYLKSSCAYMYIDVSIIDFYSLDIDIDFYPADYLFSFLMLLHIL